MENTTDSKKMKIQLVEGINLLAQGKRNLLCGEVHQAVNQLEEASKIFAQEYGELADECSDAYFSYGKALLELHRLESTALGVAITNEDEEEDDEEEEEVDRIEDNNELEDEREEKESDDESLDSSEQSEELVDEDYSDCNNGDHYEKFSANNDIKEAISIEHNTDHGGKMVENITKTNESNEKSLSETRNDINSDNNKNVSVTGESQASTSKNQNEGKIEDISSLQLAWEVLELAKLIFSRQETSEAKLKLSDTFFKLGDVGLESEQFADAIKDYESCLSLQQEVLAKDNRCLAETLYQLGLAHTLKADYKPAYDFFNKTIKVMEMRIARLEKVASGELEASPDDMGDGFYTATELAGKEVKELEELIKELYLKIEEIKDEESNASKVSLLMKESLMPTKHTLNSATTSSKMSENTCNNEVVHDMNFSDNEKNSMLVNNITHLVRKKKNIDTISENGTKKAKLV